jgi:cell division protein FtsB
LFPSGTGYKNISLKNRQKQRKVQNTLLMKRSLKSVLNIFGYDWMLLNQQKKEIIGISISKEGGILLFVVTEHLLSDVVD